MQACRDHAQQSDVPVDIDQLYTQFLATQNITMGIYPYDVTPSAIEKRLE